MSAPVEPRPCLLSVFDDPSCLIYGIGNDGRQDDGLGWALIDRLERRGDRLRATTRRTYQLALEDADLISRFTKVLFVDATTDPAVTSVELTRPQPHLDISFASHALSVPAVLATARQCFDTTPQAVLLAIRGYRWELRTGLSRAARQNLDSAVQMLTSPNSGLWHFD